MKRARPCAARARAIQTLPRSTRGSCCAAGAAASRRRARRTGAWQALLRLPALLLGGLARGGFGLLDPLGRLAHLSFRFFLEAGAQRFHEIDDLGAGLGRFGHRDLLALDLL